MEHWKNIQLEDILYQDTDGNLLKEEWKVINNVKERYLISNLGRVKSVRGDVREKRQKNFKEKILTHVIENGNHYVNISQNFEKNTVTDSVRILIGIYFLNYEPNNRLQRLEYVDSNLKEPTIYNLKVTQVITNEHSEFKKCKVCNKIKSLDQFDLNANFKSGYYSKCKDCKHLKILTEDLAKSEFLQKLRDLKNNEYELVGEYSLKNSRVNLLHKNCGNIWNTLKTNVFKRNCGYCNLSNKSSLSSRIEKYLCSNNICYKSEYTFKDCMDKRALPFDYAIFNCDKLEFLIEADGEQHFKESGFKGITLEERIKKDTIKNEYCKNNNINLLRISYLQEDEVETILDSLNIITECNCYNEVKDYYTKSIVTEEQAEKIRELYILDGYSVKKISRELGISATPIEKVVSYKIFPHLREDLKETIREKQNRLKKNNKSFKELTEYEINEIISLKKECVTDTEIGKMFSICRKSFINFIDGWGDLCKKDRRVVHIDTKMIFDNLTTGCNYFNLVRHNEVNYLKNNSGKRSFDYFIQR